jgi:hypothetical protein
MMEKKSSGKMSQVSGIPKHKSQGLFIFNSQFMALSHDQQQYSIQKTQDDLEEVAAIMVDKNITLRQLLQNHLYTVPNP